MAAGHVGKRNKASQKDQFMAAELPFSGLYSLTCITMTNQCRRRNRYVNTSQTEYECVDSIDWHDLDIRARGNSRIGPILFNHGTSLI